MKMLKRKMEEIGSALYRALIFPFVRIGIEIKTKSIMKPGSYIMKGTKLMGRNYIGKNTVLSHTILGFGSYVQSGGDITDTEIGKYTSIGSDVATVLGSHPVDRDKMHPAFYSSSASLGYTYVKEDTYEERKYIGDADRRISVKIGNDVWIGNHAKIMEGVTVADGSVIGACSLVTQDTQAYGIYGGVPAKLIRKRFPDEKIEELREFKWWDNVEENI